MALYLVQHGKSLPEDKDPQKGLSEEGKEQVERIARVASNYGVKVKEIRHSGKARALQTAIIFAEILGIPKQHIRESRGLNPKDPVEPIADFIDPKGDLMLVGHLPFLEGLTGYLICQDRGRRVFRFQNAGIVCLEQDSESRQWFIKWTLMPAIG